jgi:hypothetical protein
VGPASQSPSNRATGSASELNPEQTTGAGELVEIGGSVNRDRRIAVYSPQPAVAIIMGSRPNRRVIQSVAETVVAAKPPSHLISRRRMSSRCEATAAERHAPVTPIQDRRRQCGGQCLFSILRKNTENPSDIVGAE